MGGGKELNVSSKSVSDHVVIEWEENVIHICSVHIS